MFRMLQVIGISERGFSEAVEDAVRQVTESGCDVHFFEVVEQRGAVRAGKIKEFQVKVNVGVKSAAGTAEEKGGKDSLFQSRYIEELP